MRLGHCRETLHIHPARAGALALSFALAGCSSSEGQTGMLLPGAPTCLDAGAEPSGNGESVDTKAGRAVGRGREIFRYDTFGDEAFWTDGLGLNRAVAGEAHGGVGAGLSPSAALGVGLKVDAEALPDALVEQIRAGKVDLDDPATTLSLLELDAVVGVKGVVSKEPRILTSIGIQCALCHSTVDDSFAPGIGKRLDGWPNRDLDVGAIIALAPNLSPLTTLLGVDEETVRRVVTAWGPGRFDGALFLDGKGFRPDGQTAATLLPPAYGLAGVNLHTYTGRGSVPYWNALVANLLMGGQGTFFDPRLDDATQFPIAARAGFGHVRHDPDRITPKLADLHAYQMALPVPAPVPGSFNPHAAARGQELFNGKARCASCHTPPLFTEPGWNLHTPAEIGIDDFTASRSPTGRYRTTPLAGLASHAKGGFYHDGRFATLLDVIAHYDAVFALELSDAEKRDLAEYLKTL